LNNCTLSGNSAAQSDGGGSYGGTLNNCTLTGNSAGYCGGAAYGELKNCILYYNTATSEPNWSAYGSTLNYCCTTPLPTSGVGNITAEPQLASASHLSAASPCRGAGSASHASGADIDGESWLTPPAIGCDEYRAGAVTGPLTVAAAATWTNVAVGVAVDLRGWISGRVAVSAWNFGDGAVLSNRPYASHAWAVAGTYTVVLRAYNESYPTGVAAAVTIRVVAQPVHFVSATSSSPVPPYSSWATAARCIQEAVDAALPGALVLVSNGVYANCGRAVDGTMSNRVAVDRPMEIRSINGPGVTVIQGRQVPGTTNGDGAIRCVYLTNGAVLSGFTLTNGATRASWLSLKERGGGGVWCASASARVTNCVLQGNSAESVGGGAYSGALNNCTLTGNSAGIGGGTYSGILNNCTLTGNAAVYGGGASEGTLQNCTLTGNSASYGGGAEDCVLNNSSLVGNLASESGGGAYYATLNNCTLSGNSAVWGGGGTRYGTLNNCILYYNTANSGPNYYTEAHK
jgi:hypothetical protein